jgi:hypothetical protein
MGIHNYLQLFAIGIWVLTHLVIDAAPVLLPVAAGLAALRSYLHRHHDGLHHC